MPTPVRRTHDVELTSNERVGKRERFGVRFDRHLAERRGDNRTAAVGGDEGRHLTTAAALEKEDVEPLKIRLGHGYLEPTKITQGHETNKSFLRFVLLVPYAISRGRRAQRKPLWRAQRADPLPGDGGDRVAERAHAVEAARLAEPGRRVIGPQEVHLDLGACTSASRLVSLKLLCTALPAT